MYHPTTRVLAILELLQAHGQLSGADLAARLDVNRRTVRRYITMLQELGIPIDAERGPYGGYRLRPGFKLPPLMLTDDEALAVVLSLVGARGHGIAADAHTIEGALAKIERVLPHALRARLQAVQSAVTFNASANVAEADSTVFVTISTAVKEQRRMWVLYGTESEGSERVFDPYGLVYHWERWYVVGWCHLRHALRTFRLDRVVDARLESDHFERPLNFDSLAHVHHALATTPWGWETEVVLDTTIEDAQRYVPAGIALLEQCAEGVVMRAYVDDLDWWARQLLGLRCSWLVRQPPELRDALREIARKATAIAVDK